MHDGYLGWIGATLALGVIVVLAVGLYDVLIEDVWAWRERRKAGDGRDG